MIVNASTNQHCCNPSFYKTIPLSACDWQDSDWIAEVEESAKLTDEADLIREAWLRSVNRPPTPTEVDRAKEHLASAKSTEEGMADLLWALMNTKEFILNH